MPDLANALKEAGHTITGSDEEINDNSKAKLLKNSLLPNHKGWSTEIIKGNLDEVIIGTDVKVDNPELMMAQQLKVPIYSLPDFIYRQSSDKQRVVIAGTYSKTLIAGLIIHVLHFHRRKFDYVIGAQISGWENQVKLSDAPLIIIEGQDVMSSVLDPIPTFLKYRHHIGVISGIEWQVSESYPTKEEYVRQFSLFGAATPKGGVLVYLELDPVVAVLSTTIGRPDVLLVPYKTHASTNEGGQEFLITLNKERLPLKITGKHNFQNISAAQEALKRIGITSEMFYEAVTSFGGLGS